MTPQNDFLKICYFSVLNYDGSFTAVMNATLSQFCENFTK